MSETSNEARAGELRAGPFAPVLGAVAGLVLRPWFDALALPGIVRWYFPLSRAWAAAEIAGADVDRFAVETGCLHLPERLTARVLAATAARERRYRTAAAAWEERFFAARFSGAAALLDTEAARQDAAHGWMAMRSAFVPLHLRTGFPALKWQAMAEAEVEKRHGARRADPTAAFPVPAPSGIALSHAVARKAGRTRWLRFPASVAGTPDTAWARVIEPADASDPPTLIFLHGIGVESEFWAAEMGRVDRLVEAGIRVVRPEAPWHGRRRTAGWYGGEPIMAQGPLGLLDLFAASIGELAALLAWARETSRGPVAVGGVSLGALTSQLLASVAAGWPAALRPDALFLVGTTADVVGAALSGGLGQALGAEAQLSALAWSPAAIQRWAPLLQPQGPPVMAADAVVMVIGTSDVVTPFDGGMALARRWAVPAENLFLRRQGHFSVALGIEHDTAPVERLVAILRRMRRV
jgi:pimeloyl-ACP methyl ester carboxylesterase